MGEGLSPDRKGKTEGRSQGCWEHEWRLPVLSQFIFAQVSFESLGRTKNLPSRTTYFRPLLPATHRLSLISPVVACIDEPNTCRHRVHWLVWADKINIALPWRTFVAGSVSEDKTSFRKTIRQW